MPVLRRVFLPECPRLLPALLAGIVAVVLDVLWFVTGSAAFGVAALPFVWIAFRHIGLRYVDRKTTINTTWTVGFLLLLAPAIGCGDDNPPQTLDQCIELARKEYWGCHTSWQVSEQICLGNFGDEQSICEMLFPVPAATTQKVDWNP